MDKRLVSYLRYVFFVALTAAILFFVFNEIYLRVTGQFHSLDYFSNNIKKCLLSDECKKKIETDLAKKLVNSNDLFISEQEKTYINIDRPDLDFGHVLMPDIVGRIFLKKDGKIIFNTHPTINKDGYRITKEKPNKKTKNFLVLMGGSKTFGWGLDDEFTVASKYQSANKQTRVFNFGVGGYGLQHFIRAFELSKYDGLIKSQKGTFVYIFDPFHVERFIGSSYQPYVFNGPNYKISKDQKSILYNGSFWEGHPLRTRFYFWLAHSATFRRYNLKIPFYLDEDDYLLFAKSIEYLNSLIKEKFPEASFHTITFYKGKEYKKINKFLEKNMQINHLFLPEFYENNNKNYMNYHFRYDGHPNEHGSDLMAKKLEVFLKNAATEVFDTDK